MFHLITGGSGSGKSEYAEAEVMRLAELTESKEKYYIATMFPYGEETLQKIQRHQKMRAGKGFRTLECYTDLQGMVASNPFSKEEQTAGRDEQQDEQRFRNDSGSGARKKHATVLLECMSNLLANECYMGEGARGRGLDQVTEIEKGMESLLECCEHVVVVTNEVFSDVPVGTEEMECYLEYLGKINRWMAKKANQVTEVVYGIPLDKKTNTVENFPLKSVNGGKDGWQDQSCKIEVDEEEQEESDKVEQVEEERKQNFEMEQSGGRGEKRMRMYIGGAYQGKLSYAKQQNPGLKWRDGASCTLEELLEADGVYRFQEFIRNHKEIEDLAERLIQGNPKLVIVTDEIGYGLVPVEEEARNFRERTGRICTKLAEHCESVERIVCGLPTRIR